MKVAGEQIVNQKRVMLRVAYDGTHYHGWQVQPNANTIEAELNLHLSELLKEKIQVIGASRTDAGVHALGNVAVFDTTARMPGEKISYALNNTTSFTETVEGVFVCRGIEKIGDLVI